MSVSGVLDYERLGRYLKVLAEPNRLVLLHKLQLPHAVSDIELRASRASSSQNADRIVSRRNVEAHLARLDELGLVHTREVRRDGRPTLEYLVNHGRLFVVVEELRRLSLIQPPPHLAPDHTEAPGVTGAGARPGPALPDGPALISVGGPQEGRAFALVGDGPWRIGRSRDNDVALHYDPFVTSVNAVLHRDGRRFRLKALQARNGTRVNWQPLAADDERSLEPGDVIGVGRSSLVFRGL